MMNILKNLLVLTLFWVLVWGVFAFVLRSSNIDYVNNFIFTSVYFGLGIVILYRLFRVKIKKHVTHFSFNDIAIISLVYVAAAAIFLLLKNAADPVLMDEAKTVMDPIFWLDDRMLISKTFEIMFQQAFFIVSIEFIFKNRLSRYLDIFLFGLYSLTIHLPVFIFLSFNYALFLALAAFFSGIIFAYLITQYERGFLWSYLAHFIFYVIIPSAYWLSVNLV